MVYPDFDETRKRALEEYPNGYGYSPTPPREPEYDYSVIKMPDGTYVIGRTDRLGSLIYDYVASAQEWRIAKDIVAGLNK